MKKLLNTYLKIKKKFGFSFFTKKQKYEFSYKIYLKNKDKTSKVMSLIIPVPQSRFVESVHNKDVYQEFAANSQVLSEEIKYLPKNIRILKDEVFGNKYGIWEVKLSPGENKILEMKFLADVSPAPVLNKNRFFSFDEYGKVLMQKNNKFLSSNRFISGDDRRIKAFASQIRSKSNYVLDAMRHLNDFVIEYLDYGNPYTGLFSTQEALEKKCVDCGGFSALFASIAIAMGVPCRIVCGFFVGYKESTMHAWSEFMLPDGSWIAVDPSVEQLFRHGQTAKSGQFGFVGSDRIAFSIGCDIPVVIDGKKHYVDILQNPHLYPEKEKDGVEVKVECRSSRFKS